MNDKRCLAGTIVLVLVMFFFALVRAEGAMTGKQGHEAYIYPMVRITHADTGGSGTVIYSKLTDVPRWKGYSTYVLTNHHVIDGAIRIVDEWDSDLQKQVKREKRDVVYVEIYKYRATSTPIGTLKVEADIVLYDADQDLALLRMRTEEKAEYVAMLFPKGKEDEVTVLTETIAVGSTLGFPPLPTVGILTRKGFLLQALEFWMSSAQICYGNSGGAMFLPKGDFIGIPSRVAVIGWGTPITHMGLFIPIDRIYKWLEEQHYTFIWDGSKSEQTCLQERQEEIDSRKEAAKK